MKLCKLEDFAKILSMRSNFGYILCIFSLFNEAFSVT
jgi:hypothetical protein